MRHEFIGRTRELAVLDTMNERDDAKFLILYGRRRVGKTRLLTHWAETRDKPILYWVARQQTEARVIASFSQAFHKFAYPDQTVDETFSYQTWEKALAEVIKLAEKKDFALIIDEFTYVIAASMGAASEFQIAWDQKLSGTGIFLILSGSHIHMMHRIFDRSNAPLFGRATARIHLKPLRYAALPLYFPNYEPDELVAAYSILGGIPAYLQLFNPKLSLGTNIKNVLLVPDSQLQSEAMLLLHEQFDEPKVYMTLLQAVAYGNHTRKEITEFTSMTYEKCSPYLDTLLDVGLLERRIPITVRFDTDSRKGRYHVADPYLRFYFRFIEPRLEDIEREEANAMLAYVKKHLRAFVGENAFEGLCREWLFIAGGKDKIPFHPERSGSYWGSDAQIDVAAINEWQKQVAIGECKWGVDKVGIDVVEKLARQSTKMISHLKDSPKWTSHLYIFTRTGLTVAAQKRADELKVRVVTLEELDQDLRVQI